MSYQPILPTSGLTGWRFLQKTMDRQLATHAASADVQRDIAYFRENAAKADTPEKLIEDRQLLKVALGAFGLGDDINKKAYVRKMLEEGTDNRSSFANRVVDPRWRDMVGAFGYGDAKGAQTGKESFVEQVISAYEYKSFEISVGDVDQSQRLAMHFDRQAKTLALTSSSGSDTGWLKILGDKPMRAVMEKALGLPSEFVKLDLDQQVTEVKDKMSRLLGTDDIKALADDDNRDKLMRRYFVREQMEAGPSQFTPGAAALTLLQSGGSANLFQSLL